MIYTVTGKRISNRLQGEKGTRHHVTLSNNVDGDDGWDTTMIVTPEVFAQLNFGDQVEINFFRISGAPAQADPNA